MQALTCAMIRIVGSAPARGNALCTTALSRGWTRRTGRQEIMPAPLAAFLSGQNFTPVHTSAH
jgi:hypothetical protein